MPEPAVDGATDQPPIGADDDVRVILADEHPEFRDGLAELLDSAAGIRVVGRASDGHEAIDLVGQLHPDVVVMDLNLPDLDGVEATRRLTAESPHVGVVVLTVAEDDDIVFAAMRAGARGYLLKEAGPDDIVRSITAVARGEAVFGAAVARRIMDYFASGPPSTTGAGPLPELTPREREVLDLVAAGRANAEIAGLLFLSPRTVRNIVSNIFAKLHVSDRAEAIIRARDGGLGHA